MTGIASPSLIVKVSFGSSLRRVSFQAAEAASLRVATPRAHLAKFSPPLQVYYEQFKEKVSPAPLRSDT